MTTKRFIIINGVKKGTHSGIWDKEKQHNQGIGDELWLGEVVAMLNEGVILAEENEQLKQRIEDYNKALKTLQDVYERKDRQLQRAKKDTRKYTDYFMNELNWDCDRIIEEVFR